MYRRRNKPKAKKRKIIQDFDENSLAALFDKKPEEDNNVQGNGGRNKGRYGGWNGGRNNGRYGGRNGGRNNFRNGAKNTFTNGDSWGSGWFDKEGNAINENTKTVTNEEQTTKKRTRTEMEEEEIIEDEQQKEVEFTSKRPKLNNTDPKGQKSEKQQKKQDEDNGPMMTAHAAKLLKKRTGKEAGQTSQKLSKSKVIKTIRKELFNKVKLDGLPHDTQESDIAKYLEIVATPLDVHLFHSQANLKLDGYALVTFSSVEHAEKVVGHLWDTLFKTNACPDGKKIDFLPYLDKSKKEEKAIAMGRTANKELKDTNGSDSSDKYAMKRKVVRLSNLNYRTTENDIYEFFYNILKFQPVAAKIHVDAQQFPYGEAHAEFANPQQAANAVKKCNGEYMLKRSIFVELTDSRHVLKDDGWHLRSKTDQVCFFNVHRDIDEKVLEEAIQHRIGVKPVNVHLVQHLTKFVPGYAIIQLPSPQHAASVVEEFDGTEIGARNVKVMFSDAKKPSPMRHDLKNFTNMLTFSNVRFDCDKTDIEDAIAEHCNIDGQDPIIPTKIVILENQKGFRYGLAKVTFRTNEEATIVQENLDNKLIKGKPVHINFWREFETSNNRQRTENNYNRRWRDSNKSYNTQEKEETENYNRRWRDSNKTYNTQEKEETENYNHKWRDSNKTYNTQEKEETESYNRKWRSSNKTYNMQEKEETEKSNYETKPVPSPGIKAAQTKFLRVLKKQPH